MQSFTPAVANTLHIDMVARADGTPIVAGTVNVYVVALTGTNAGKWFKASDDSWSATQASSGTATHKADGHWTCVVDAACWTAGVRYFMYAKESGDLHIPYSEEIIKMDDDALGANEWTYTLTSSTTSLPISGAFVWVTTDVAGANIVASGYTNTFGVVTFYLDDGTYYVWRSHADYSFTNPDTEVVP